MSLVIEGLKKGFRRGKGPAQEVLRGVDLVVEPGQLAALVGVTAVVAGMVLIRRLTR